MHSLPKTPELGPLELLEVYEYYDQPVLFSCRSAVDLIYLAVLIGEEEFGERWMYVAMSQMRFVHMRSGAIDLYDSFVNAENSYVYILETPYDDLAESTLTTLTVDEIPQEWLPETDEFVKLKTATLPALEKDVARVASQANREYLRVALNFFDSLRTEAPAKLLGEILQGIQDTLDAIGEVNLGQQSAIGKIPKDIVDKVEMSVIKVGAGSFEVELASSHLVDLFKESPAGNSLGELIHLVSLGDDPTELREHLSVLKNRVAARYVKLLDALGKTVTSVDLSWASPNPRRGGEASITSDVALRAKTIIEHIEEVSTKEVEIVGRLIGANLRMKNYEIETRDFTYAGRVANEALESIYQARLGEIYSAKINQVTTIKAVTGIPDVKYELIHLGNKE